VSESPIEVGDRVVFSEDVPLLSGRIPAWSSGMVERIVDGRVRVMTDWCLLEVDPDILIKAEPVKRFVLFGAPNYHPAGGWDDHKGSFDSAEEAAWAGGLMAQDYDGLGGFKWHVVDLMTGVTVGRGEE
jgi:hypothetical protein